MSSHSELDSSLSLLYEELSMSISYYFLCHQECGLYIRHRGLQYCLWDVIPSYDTSSASIDDTGLSSNDNCFLQLIYYQTGQSTLFPYLSVHTKTFISGINGSKIFCKVFQISIKLNICRANNVQISVKVTMTKFTHMCIMSHHNRQLVDSDYETPSDLRQPHFRDVQNLKNIHLKIDEIWW